MKKIIVTFLLSISAVLFAQKVPQINKTEFSKEALSEHLTTMEGKHISAENIISQYKGKILIIDFWASWCKDCILALPKTKELKEKNPDIDFVYFSLDRSEEQWKKGLEKYGLEEEKNYWFQQGWKNEFNNYIDLNWVPRFIVVNQEGKIAKYYAISPEDPELLSTIETLRKN